MRRATILLASVAAIVPSFAYARDERPADLPKPAADPVAATDPENAAPASDIIVVGTGQTRQVQELRAADLDILAAGTSPLKAIAKLPNVNFQSADAFGAYRQAFKTDPTSAFGGIIAFNRKVDLATAQAVSKQFMEVLLAPGYDDDALALLAAKKNVRVLTLPLGDGQNAYDVKRVGGGWLVQTPDFYDPPFAHFKVVTSRKPTENEMNNLLFAWKVAKFVKSNAIVFAGNGLTLGVGAGQMSRIDSARIASIKAANAGLSLKGSAAASDAFFPFRDGLDVIVDAGATCVIQPGGSVRDDEVIAAAEERGIAMVLTGTRHFRH